MSINKTDESVVTPDADLPSSRDSVDATVNEKRRRLTKFAVGAPVLVTLASRPVLAVQCLSSQLSGNLSPGHVSGQCTYGSSPVAWGQPGGTVGPYSTVSAWTAVGLTYGPYTPGTYTPGISSTSDTKNFDRYADGATLANVPIELNKDALASTTLLRVVLTSDPNTHQLTRHLVCAYLNALLSALPGSSFHYILTPEQVLGLANGTTSYPTTYTTLQSFLGSTWS